MNFYAFDVVLQEVPGEVSLCFSITGCPLRCKGCHSSHLWKAGSGKPLTKEIYLNYLDRYNGLASCVLFMGGEWHRTELMLLLDAALEKGYQTCLYTGEEKIDNELKSKCTWLKSGPWIQELGGLDSKHTNQKFTHTQTGELLNYLFIKN